MIEKISLTFEVLGSVIFGYIFAIILFPQILKYLEKKRMIKVNWREYNKITFLKIKGGE